MKNKSFVPLLLCSIFCFLTTYCFAFKQVKTIEELKEARLYVHILNFKEAQDIYVQFPDAGEMLIINVDREVSSSVIEYVQRQFAMEKGKFVSGLRSFLGWRHHLDIMINTYLSSSSINDLFSLFREMDISTLLSPLSKDIPVTGKFSYPEIDKLTYLIRNYPGYSSIKRNDYIPIPKQERVNIKLEVLSPQSPISFYDYSQNFKNKEWLENNVIVLKLTFNNISILFPSLIGEKAQKDLVKIYKDKLSSSILVLPEGKTLIPSFLEKVTPQLIINKDIIIITDGEKVYLKPLKKIEPQEEKKIPSKKTLSPQEVSDLEKKAAEDRILQQQRISEQQKRLEEQRKAEEEIRERERKLEEQRRREEEERKKEEDIMRRQEKMPHY